MANLYLLMGYPGAGKTTTAKVIQGLTNAQRISSDEVRVKLFPNPSFSQAEHDQVYRHIDREVELLLKERKDVIYDANLNRYRHRKDKYDICARTQATPVLLWVQTPKELAKSRAVHHSRSHLVPHEESPAAMFERIANVIEQPHVDEPYISIDGTRVSSETVASALKL